MIDGLVVPLWKRLFRSCLLSPPFKVRLSLLLVVGWMVFGNGISSGEGTFFVWEEDLLLEFQKMLGSVQMLQREDFWIWKLHSSGIFNVKSAYDFLINKEIQDMRLSDLEVTTFKLLWKSNAPLKVVTFSW